MLHENIFKKMTTSSEFFRTVLPHLREEYFNDVVHINIYKKIKQYNDTYSKQPRISDIKLLIESDNSISETISDEVYAFLDSLKTTEEVSDEKLLVKETERFCQDRALENAILESVEIIQDKKKEKGMITDIVKQALAVEFDVSIGEDYYRDIATRFSQYLETEDKIPLDIENINIALGGGVVKQSIFFFLANTGVGKSIFLAHATASLTKAGHNILYLSGELSCKEVQKRLDANLLDMPVNGFNQALDKDQFKSKVKDLCSQSHGELIVKYCPAGTVNSQHIKNILNEIYIKKGYKPTIIIMDHLTLFASYRLPSSQAGTHLYVRSVVEEVRAVAVEEDCCILSAAQLGRGAKAKNSDVSNEDVALSYAIAETADWCSVIIQTPELKEQGRFLLKVTKSRFGSNTEHIYNVGIDYEHMRLLNVDDTEAIPIHIQDKLKFEKQQQNEEVPNIGFDFS